MAENMANNTEAIADPASIKLAAEALSAPSRRERQQASSALLSASTADPCAVAPYGAEIIEALSCKEARTRWECLDILTNLVHIDSRLCDKAVPDAESCLFDEDNGFVRLSAFRFLCKLGSTTENRSDKVWPLLDEAIQCYHGDPEFHDMLNVLMEFAAGKASPEVKQALADRMSFDAENAKSGLKRRAQAVIDSALGK